MKPRNNGAAMNRITQPTASKPMAPMTTAPSQPGSRPVIAKAKARTNNP